MTTDHTDLEARLRLLGLKGMGPARLDWLLSSGSASIVLDSLRRGSLPTGLSAPIPGVGPDLIRAWSHALNHASVRASVADHRAAGIEVLAADHPHWPFGDDPEPPALAFVRGDSGLLGQRPAVAIVGTRRCTSIGRRVARQLGADLSDAGVTVVSGLATGIDGEAHRGALGGAGPLIGVVATGLDRVYPTRHAELWSTIAERGVLMSEAPLGVGPERWRFPARNRLIAALADVVVVVESHHRGGALSTVDEAAQRSVPVMAVPGSVLSSASEGTNELLVDGCGPARSAVDVLDLLGLICPGRSSNRIEQRRLPIDPLASAVLEEASTGSVALDTLVKSTGASVASVLEVVHRLTLDGEVRLEGTRVMLP